MYEERENELEDSGLDTSVIRELHEMQNYSDNLRRFLESQREEAEERKIGAEQEKETVVPIEDESPSQMIQMANDSFLKSPYPLPFLTPEKLRMKYDVDVTSDRKMNEQHSSFLDTTSISQINSPIDKFMRSSREYSSYDSPINKIEVSNLRRELDMIKLEKAALKGRLDSMRTQLESTQEELNNVKASQEKSPRYKMHNSSIMSTDTTSRIDGIESRYAHFTKILRKTEEQYKEQVAVLQNTNELQSKQMESLYKQIQDLKKEKHTVQKSLNQTNQTKDAQISQLTAENNNLKNENQTLKDNFKQRFKQQRDQYDVLQKRFDQAQQTITSLEGNCKVLKQQILTNEKDVIKGQNVRNLIDREIKNVELMYMAEIERLQKEVQSLKSAIVGIQNDNESSVTSYKKKYNDTVKQLQQEINELNSLNSKNALEKKKIESEVNILKEKLNLAEVHSNNKEVDNNLVLLLKQELINMRLERDTAIGDSQMQIAQLKKDLQEQKDQYSNLQLESKRLTQSEELRISLHSSNNTPKSSTSNPLMEKLREAQSVIDELVKMSQTNKVTIAQLHDQIAQLEEEKSTLQARIADFQEADREVLKDDLEIIEEKDDEEDPSVLAQKMEQRYQNLVQEQKLQYEELLSAYEDAQQELQLVRNSILESESQKKVKFDLPKPSHEQVINIGSVDKWITTISSYFDKIPEARSIVSEQIVPYIRQLQNENNHLFENLEQFQYKLTKLGEEVVQGTERDAVYVSALEKHNHTLSQRLQELEEKLLQKEEENDQLQDIQQNITDQISILENVVLKQEQKAQPTPPQTDSKLIETLTNKLRIMENECLHLSEQIMGHETTAKNYQVHIEALNSLISKYERELEAKISPSKVRKGSESKK